MVCLGFRGLGRSELIFGSGVSGDDRVEAGRMVEMRFIGAREWLISIAALLISFSSFAVHASLASHSRDWEIF
jgi:hypothetical protein